MKVLRSVRSGTDLAPLFDARQHVLAVAGALHQFQDALVGVLERDVEIRQDLALRHQRDHFVHMRIGIHVMQAHPRAPPSLFQLAHRRSQLGHAALERPAAPEAGAVFHVHAIGAGVLRDHQQFLHARVDQVLRFLHHIADRAADQIAAQTGDDAEGAAVVAAFGNFHVGVMFRREADALRRAPDRKADRAVWASADAPLPSPRRWHAARSPPAPGMRLPAPRRPWRRGSR